MVAGTVRPGPLLALTVATLLGAAALGGWGGIGQPWHHPLHGALRAIVAAGAALAASGALVRRAVRRFGGISGDVLGATIEASTTAALVVLAAH
jgi:adenosylcobinamide-GDP ribazoletransferase